MRYRSNMENATNRVATAQINQLRICHSNYIEESASNISLPYSLAIFIIMSRPRPTCRKTVGLPMVLSCPANVLDKRAAKEETYDSDSPEVLSSSDEEDRWKETARTADIPAEYWNIQKLMKYIKAGNPTTTMVSLNCIMDYDLSLQINQLAILVGSAQLMTFLDCILVNGIKF